MSEEEIQNSETFFEDEFEEDYFGDDEEDFEDNFERFDRPTMLLERDDNLEEEMPNEGFHITNPKYDWYTNNKGRLKHKKQPSCGYAHHAKRK